MRTSRGAVPRLTPAALVALLALLALVTGVLGPLPGPSRAAVPGATTTAAAAAVDRPNVVLVLVDDMRLDELRHLPRTRALLGDAGTTFANAVAPNPVCCPARAALLTGQWSHNNGVLSNKGHNGGRDPLDEQQTLPVALQAAGYSTAFHGKYLNGYDDAETDPVPAGWDWWDATGRGTYAYTDFEFAAGGEPEYFADDYVTTRLRQRSDDTLRRLAEVRRQEGRPFFVVDSYVAPHDAKSGGDADPGDDLGSGPIPEPRYADSFSSLRAPATGTRAYYRPIRGDEVGGPFAASRRYTRAELDELTRQRARALASVDDAVAGTVETLRDLGELERTVVFFLSDNGYLLGEHRRYGKQVVLEESIRVPLLVRGPGMAVGETSRRWAPQQAVTATILDLARAVTPWELDAASLVGAGAGDPAPRSALLVENGSKRATGPGDEKWHWRGVMLGERYRYARWRSFGSAVELYDRQRDPQQLVNLARHPAYRPVVRQARGALRALRDCSGSCELPLDRLARPRRR